MGSGETAEELIRVTPAELHSVLGRLEGERATRLAIVGAGLDLAADPNAWPQFLRGQSVYQISQPWPDLIGRVSSLKLLEQLVLLGANIGDAGAFAIAEHLTQLKSLAVGRNEIGEAGALAIAEKLTHLTSLSIGSNKIGEAGARAIAEKLTHLTSLSIAYNKIGEAGARAIVEHLTQLKSLSIGGNEIGDAGARAIAEKLTQLNSLTAGTNEIGAAGILAIAEKLNHLTSLSVENNQIGEGGARAIAEKLNHLTSLNVENNEIGEGGARAIAENLPHLSSLWIGNNNIGEAGARAISKHLTQLTSLSIGSNEIGDAGARAIAESLAQLNSLSVWSNEIGDAGALAISKRLTQLTSLSIGSNKIGDAGARAIAESLTQLNSLSVWSNEIGVGGARAIAENLTQLNSLDVDRNKIGESGARSIAENLTLLQTLRVEGNQIGQLTIAVLGQNLQNLTRLWIGGNKDIRDIGPLAGLPMLRQLNVWNTSVSDLAPFADRINDDWPVYWDRWSTVAGLSVEDCPLVRPTVEIAQQGPKAVRNYFRELATQGEDFLYEAKVLILGEGGAGKTSLLRRLYQPDRQLPNEDETTRGINIHRQDFVGNRGQPFRLNVWDFGGQQIYHATHQFFLTKNSLYLLVDDTRKDDKTIHDEGFKFWLEVVETLSDGSPLLIFQNEKGGRSKTIDQAGIQGRFNNVKDVHRGNLEHLGAVHSVKQAIECFVQQLPHIGERVPKKWVAIRQELEQQAVEKTFITLDEYFEVYRRHLPFDRTKAMYLSRYLHDLGAFLHFQDDPLLSKTVILQNQWATEAVFRILDDETIKSQRGRFSGADCQRLWADSAYAGMHFELRGLMEKFDLCYRLSAQHDGQWLAPQLLSPSKPTELANWAKPDDLVLRYHYPFLPRGLVSRLIVRQHRFVKRLANCWARGAFFEQNGTQALAEETAKGNEIELRARGPEHKALLSVLSNELESLNDSFKGLIGRVEKLVPCLCAVCSQTTTPEMFKQSVLVERKQAGKKPTIECHKSGDDVSLLALLDGLRLEQLPNWATKPTNPDDAADLSTTPKTTTIKPPTLKKSSKATKLTTTKIFLASSAELLDDRDEFDLYFRQQNDHLKDQGVYLQIVRWEHFLDAISESRKQDDYNEKLRDCNIVVCLFKTKVGKYTEEEFDHALKEFKAKGEPKIFTFFRDFQMTNDQRKSMKSDLASLDAFQQKLSELGHFWTNYDDAEHLKRQFRDQLTHLKVLT